MQNKHIVKQGEYLAQIAAEYGFSDYKFIWDFVDNAELKNKRKSPNLLYPGDILVIPDRHSKEQEIATDQRHRFRLLQKRLPKIKMRLRDINDQPLVDKNCVLIIELQRLELTSDGDGVIEKAISLSDKKGTLSIENYDIPLQIGSLDPVETISGQQARLASLGYYFGSIDAKEGPLFKLAVEEFQCDQNLSVTGLCDANTQDKLKKIYGC